MVTAQVADLDPWRHLPSTFAHASDISTNSLQVHRIPVDFTLRALEDDRRWGLRIMLPISFGFHNARATTELRFLGLRLPWIALGYRFGDVFPGVRSSFSFSS